MLDVIEKEGRRFRVDIEHDIDHGAPWEEGDGHGVVSDWVTRDEYAGERILHQERSSRRYYDVKATMAIALKDWGLSDEERAKLTAKLGRAPTKREIAAEAVERDFENLRAWCSDEWWYVGVVVTDITDDPDTPIDYTHALWGIESNEESYLEEVAHELVSDALGETRRKAQLAAEAEAAHRAEYSDLYEQLAYMLTSYNADDLRTALNNLEPPCN